jgi:hypothetical protein
MRSLGFGLERVVDPIFRWPRISAFVVLCVIALGAVGLTQLQFDQNLRGVFAGTTDVYKDYISTVEDFVDPENEILILVEGPGLGEPKTFAKLRNFQFELQFIEGIRNVTSAFSLRHAPDANDDAPLLITEADGGLTRALLEQVRAHPLFGNKLLSADGTAMMFVLTPSEEKAPFNMTREMRGEIDGIAADLLGDTGLSVTISGFAILRLDIVDVLIRDQIALNIAGVIVGILMSFFVFRSVIAAVMTAIPAMIAGGAVLGTIGLLGIQLTVMSNVVPALIMILGYADAMHLTYAWRRYRAEGADAREAARLAQKEVGPACMLTAITTSLAFLSLTLSDVELVSKFARIGAVASIVGAMIVLSMHTLIALYVGPMWKPGRSFQRSLLVRLGGPSAAVGRFAVNHAKRIAVGAILLFAVLAVMHFSVPPQNSIREHLPTNNPANAALAQIDTLFDGAFPIQIVVPVGDLAPTSPEGLARLRDVHEAVAKVEGAGRPLSLWSVAQWLGGDLEESSRRLTRLVEDMPPETASRFLGREGATLISTSVHELSTEDTVPLIAGIEAAARSAGGPDVIVTGATVLTTKEADRTISNLFWSLTLAVVAGIVAMMLAFRDWRVGAVALLPNAMPIFATGALLYISNRGMQFTSVMSLTVAFGIAVNDTIHYLSRFKMSDASQKLGDRIIDTSRHMGPVLLGTTAIIIAGLSTTFVSRMPTISLFGELAGVTLAAALIGDLIVLPALMAGVARPWFERKKASSTGAPREDEAVRV